MTIESTTSIFTDGRTYNAFQPVDIESGLLEKLYELTALAPTSANTNPGRFVFVKSPEMKEKLASCADLANQPKILSAPVTVIVAGDTRFYEFFPQLFPQRAEAAAIFASNDALRSDTMDRNTVLSGGYMILAARALGLDCGPMSGFSREKCDELFFPDGRWKSNFLCNLGYGDKSGLWPRNPRLAFGEACKII